MQVIALLYAFKVVTVFICINARTISMPGLKYTLGKTNHFYISGKMAHFNTRSKIIERSSIHSGKYDTLFHNYSHCDSLSANLIPTPLDE